MPTTPTTPPTTSPSQTRTALLEATTAPPTALLRTLITANHILHHHDVVDAFGHISVRNPHNPRTFLLSRSVAPACVARRQDIEEYRVADAGAVLAEAAPGYAERFIHSEIYARYRDVHCVVHCHSEAVIPFGVASVPLRPVFHMGGVMGATVPVFDIENHYRSTDTTHSLLVTNAHLGAGLAAGFDPNPDVFSRVGGIIKSYFTPSSSSSSSSSSTNPPTTVPFPPCPTVLMRGHGMTCVGASIEEAVHRAVYTCANARLQTQALLMQGTFNAGLVARHSAAGKDGAASEPARQVDLKYLSPRECQDSWAALGKHTQRPWEMWCAEVRCSPLYRNELDGGEV